MLQYDNKLGKELEQVQQAIRAKVNPPKSSLTTSRKSKKDQSISASDKDTLIDWVEATYHTLQTNKKSWVRRKGNLRNFRSATKDGGKVVEQAIKIARQYESN